MKLRHFAISLFLIGVVILSCIWIPIFFLNKTKQTISKDQKYFFPITITKYNNSQLPCLIIEIGNRKFSAVLDLGFSGTVSILNDYLDEVTEKEYIDYIISWGITGNTYVDNLYKVSKLKIGSVVFDNLTVRGNSKEFHKDITFKSEDDSLIEPATLGWKMFSGMNLFMDLKNDIIAYCDSFQTLIEQGYESEKFVKIPFKLDRDFLEIQAITSNGPLHCVVDTGATWNLINSKNEEAKPINEIINDPNNLTKFSSFRIGKQEFGKISFHRFPMRGLIDIEAILGMEFLHNHLVYVDFKNKELYLAKSKKNPYFISIPITNFTATQIPCILVEIGEKKIPAQIELSFGGAAISPRILQEIQQKSQVSSTVIHSSRGHSNQRNRYKLPEMKIGEVIFCDPIILEDNNDGPTTEPMTLGWGVFEKKGNLFLDLYNSKIAFCDSLKTLTEQGYRADKFIKMPLLLNHDCIEVETITPNGPLRCVINTGVTWNLINISNEEGRSYDEIAQDPESYTEFASFKIGEKDFGSISFHHLPIKAPFPVEAILGMEFLRNHLVFIDFERKEIYFAESTKEEAAPAEMAAAS